MIRFDFMLFVLTSKEVTCLPQQIMFLVILLLPDSLYSVLNVANLRISIQDCDREYDGPGSGLGICKMPTRWILGGNPGQTKCF